MADGYIIACLPAEAAEVIFVSSGRFGNGLSDSSSIVSGIGTSGSGGGVAGGSVERGHVESTGSGSEEFDCGADDANC